MKDVKPLLIVDSLDETRRWERANEEVTSYGRNSISEVTIIFQLSDHHHFSRYDLFF
jgi:hypothetical protein